MKPVANLWKDKDGMNRGLVLSNSNPLVDVDVTPLYTLHDVADFVRGLYFDDDFASLGQLERDNSVFSVIANKIEEIKP